MKIERVAPTEGQHLSASFLTSSLNDYTCVVQKFGAKKIVSACSRACPDPMRQQASVRRFPVFSVYSSCCPAAIFFFRRSSIDHPSFVCPRRQALNSASFFERIPSIKTRSTYPQPCVRSFFCAQWPCSSLLFLSLRVAPVCCADSLGLPRTSWVS